MSQKTASNTRANLISYGFLAPSMAIFLAFFIFPILFSFYVSFHNWVIGRPLRFTFLANYQYLIADPTFWVSMRNTAAYILMFVPSVALLALLVAIGLNTRIRFRNFFRALYFLPVTSSIIIVAVIWRYIYEGDFGVANYLLSLVGVPRQQFLGNPSLALPSIAVMAVWQLTGYYMVIYLAGLQSIPPELYQAAKVDGASPLQIVRWITLPLLRPMILLVVVMATISASQLFDAVYVMTFGGPGHATTSAVWYMYVTGFESFNLGLASAIGTVLFLVTFVISFLELRLLGMAFEY
jgi:multiple sugar transport system permease protein